VSMYIKLLLNRKIWRAYPRCACDRIILFSTLGWAYQCMCICVSD